MASTAPTRFVPSEVEPRWSAAWAEAGVGHADPESDRPAFAIAIPPPNVTGALHMGHALNNKIQDVLCRTRRMAGDEVEWICGTDATVPSRIFSSACWTPSPETSRVIDGLSALRAILSTSSM